MLLFLVAVVVVLLGLIRDSENEVDDNSQQEDNGQNGRAESVVEAGLAPHSYTLGSPVVCHKGV